MEHCIDYAQKRDNNECDDEKESHSEGELSEDDEMETAIEIHHVRERSVYVPEIEAYGK